MLMASTSLPLPIMGAFHELFHLLLPGPSVKSTKYTPHRWDLEAFGDQRDESWLGRREAVLLCGRCDM